MPKIAEETREARRQRFVDAAWRVAAAKGYRNWTVDDVCAEAGASKGAFYGYFRGKADLLIALLADDAEWTDRLIREIGGSELAVAERLRLFVQRTIQRREEAGRVQVRADLWAEMLTDPSVRAPFVASVRTRRERIQAWLESGTEAGAVRGPEARALASIALALADGLTLHRAVDPAAFQWRNVHAAVDVLLRGLDGSQ